MRTTILSLFALAGFSSGFSIQRIPTPVDSVGNPYSVTGAGIPRPGLMAVSTRNGMFWQSTDRGVHWSQIPSPTGSSTPEFFGSQLITADEKQIWTGTAWKAVSYPAPYLQAQQMWMTSGTDWSPGVATAFQLSDSSYWVVRSTDSLQTWTEWLHFPLHNIPVGADGEMAGYEDGGLWLPQKSSSRWQVTSNGTDWKAVGWPDTSTEYLQRASGDTVLSISGSSRDTAGRFRRSVDGGRTWSSHPLDQPGILTLPLKSGHWLCRTFRPAAGRSLRVLGVSPSPDGPWSELSSANAGLLGQDDALYYRDTTGVYRADLSGLASLGRSGRPAVGFELRRSGGRTMSIVDEIRPTRWTLARADGSLLASGFATGSFEVPAVRGGAFLSIEGMGAKRLPPF